MKSDARFRFGVAAGAVLLLLGVVAWFLISAPGLCGNDVSLEIPSPTGKWKAVIFERDCGATTGFSRQASVLPSDKKLGNDSGNIEVPSRTWDLKWASDSQLIVEYSKFYPPLRKTEGVGDVRILYEPLQ